jgi:dienelactone hydrolase
MIEAYLARLTSEVEAPFPGNFKTAEEWLSRRPELRKQLQYMLGLDPLPERTPLNATVTGTLQRDGYVVDLLHYQSRPGLYVTANLYRPAAIPAGERLPAVLYVCGHGNRGRNGVKTGYQSSPIWFAKHGYVCLIIDTVQLSEIAGIHHGTYRERRYWWVSRGYTPAGVECWNGIRGLDYLASRADVDPERIAVTGLSGGGASTVYLAAMDDRVKVAVPISGWSDLTCYVADSTVNRHCDCMFVYNAYTWPWTQIAALIAPRPLLFINSDADALFPMDGNERISNRLERFYSLFGAGDRFETLVSIGGHAYRQDIRQGVYRFINSHLKNDPRPVTDSEQDLVTGEGTKAVYPIPLEKLRVFPRDEDLPKDQINTRIDELFVPMANVEVPGAGDFEPWKANLLKRLRETSFRQFPELITPPAGELPAGDMAPLQSEEGITIYVRRLAADEKPGRCLLALTGPEGVATQPSWLDDLRRPDDEVLLCETRGQGRTRWDTKSPPNRVVRSHPLVGRTVDAGRVWDVMAAIRSARTTIKPGVPVQLVGQGTEGIIAAYAALFEPDVAGVTLIDPPMSHMDPKAPVLMNVLRVCDIPDVLGALAPRPLTLIGAKGEGVEKVRKIYEAAGASDRLTIR